MTDDRYYEHKYHEAREEIATLTQQLAAANDSVAMARAQSDEVRASLAGDGDDEQVEAAMRELTALDGHLADAAKALGGQGSEVVMVSYSRCSCCGRQTPHEFCHDCSQAGYACHPNGWGEEPAAEVCGLSDEACLSLRTVGA